MAGTTGLLGDLAIVMGAAALLGLLFHRFRQPVLVAFLVAGALVGPHTPGPQVVAAESVDILAELGIVFLLFSVGLQFRVGRLLRAGPPAVGAAVFGALAMLGAVALVGPVMGWSALDALFLGGALATSSTVIVARLLEPGPSGKRQRWQELALAVTVTEDVFGVVMLAVLGVVAATAAAAALGAAPDVSGAPGTGGGAADGSLLPLDLTSAPELLLGLVALLVAFAVAVVVLGIIVVPRVVDRLVADGADDVLVVVLGGLALVVAVSAALVGLSPALGAFLAGAVVAEAARSSVAERLIRPIRDLFTALFFVSMGMLVDPAAVAAHAWEVGVLAAVLVAVRLVFRTGPAFLLGAPPRDAFLAALPLAQVGEFSFVIVALGLSLGVVSDFLLPVTLGLVLLSALWTPYLVAGGPRLYTALLDRTPAPVVHSCALVHRWAQARWGGVAPMDSEVRRHLRRAALNGAVLIAIALGAGALFRLVPTLDLPPPGQGSVVRPEVAEALVVAGAVLLAMPFALTLAHALGRMGARALAATAPTQSLNLGLEGPTRLAVRGLLLAALAAALALLGPGLVAPFLPPLPLLLVSLAALGVALLLGWRTMARLHKRVEGVLDQVLNAEATEATREAAFEALQAAYSPGVDVAAVALPPGAVGVGASLRDLALSGRCGVRVLAIQRGDDSLLPPPVDLPLAAGDRLLLAGDAAGLDQARSLLGATPAAGPTAGPAPGPAAGAAP